MKKRFKVGEKITFLPKQKCKSRGGSLNSYYYGGTDYGGCKTEILGYEEFIYPQNCWEIKVEIKTNSRYKMLESEFEEYYQPQVSTKAEGYLSSQASIKHPSPSKEKAKSILPPPRNRGIINLNFNN